MELTRYNLGSTRMECRIPVQIQLATDEHFLTASGCHMETAQAKQVFSELSDSELDIDLCDLILQSDQNLSPVVSNTQSAFLQMGGIVYLAPWVRIFPPLFRQLFEKRYWNALSNPRVGYAPLPDRLRQELSIKEQVQESLRQLAKNARPGKDKIKSQRWFSGAFCSS